MSTSIRIANIVDELCRRQDHVLKELDSLDQQIEQVLKSLSTKPAPIPVTVPSERKAA